MKYSDNRNGGMMFYPETVKDVAFWAWISKRFEGRAVHIVFDTTFETGDKDSLVPAVWIKEKKEEITIPDSSGRLPATEAIQFDVDRPELPDKLPVKNNINNMMAEVIVTFNKLLEYLEAKPWN